MVQSSFLTEFLPSPDRNMQLSTKTNTFLLHKIAKEKSFTNHLYSVKNHHYWNRSSFEVGFSFCAVEGQLSDLQKSLLTKSNL